MEEERAREEQYVLNNISDRTIESKVMDVVWNSNYPAYILGADGRFMFVNDAFVDYTQNSRKKWLELNVGRIRHTVNPSIYEQTLKTRATVSIFQDIRIVTGKNYHQITMGIPIFSEKGEISHILVIVFPLVNELGSWKASRVPESAGKDEPAFIMSSLPMRKLVSIAEKAAETNSSILISGETGTGKGALAQFIHNRSARKDRSFSAINCAALTDNLIESELFGYDPGAFTGAAKTGKTGIIEASNGGTLFLDEINSLPLSAQGKLLRVLESHTVRRVGSHQEVPVDFRLIAAANESLLALCEKGEFRQDLYYRLNIISLAVPPLRERIDDIVPLANYFLEELCRENGRTKILSADSYRFLLQYGWPGNVRELRNFIERAVLLSDKNEVVMDLKEFVPEVDPDIIEIDMKSGIETEGFSLENYMNEMESSLLNYLTTRCSTTYEMAKILGVNQSTVVRKLQKYNIKLKTEQQEQ